MRWKDAIIRGKFNDRVFSLEDKAHNIKTSFMLGEERIGLEINRKEIKEGLAKTLLFIDMMHQLCSKRDINFVVAVIPTKETVYSKYIDVRFDKNNLLGKFIDNESKVNNEIIKHFKHNAINYIEILPFMKNNIGGPMIYTAGTDGHPNKYGYAIIAQAMAEYLLIKNLL